ncbi:hypothetical protein E4T66_07710 [Sinimarinibacterium sp. CAU 1509]|uniref:hypothetical protein n=1 Tax=Sinimarinibacterium sp. CAU 1509 TaxID=2562283 RepID=UPI0010AB6DFE|nr:hypothetical protein [Sinimarinibacterium sp. CAU 1509]TJY62109.1 hypothetical protein E4T66_07710 [Sinimarinibacterium sp. CAU 1509]
MQFRILQLVAVSAIALAPVALYAADVQSATAESEQQESATAPAETENCLTQTGSHLQRDAKHPCVNAPGQVITREQIDRSGAATTADALRKLSPAVR